MGSRKAICALALAASAILTARLSGQMPDWKYFRDREGNGYFLDQAGKMYTSGEPQARFRPPSVAGVEYFAGYGIDLIRNRHGKEGLTVLKSILAMTPSNKRVHDAQVLSAKKINEMKLRDGNRFDDLDREAYLLIYRDEANTHVINENMRFSLSIPADIIVLRSRSKSAPRYFYSGLSLGITFGKDSTAGDTGGSFDAILAIDGERYSYRIKNLKEAETIWKKILGYDTFGRKEHLREENRVIYRLENTVEPSVDGYEAISFNDDCGFIVRIITSRNTFRAHEQIMRGIVESFRLVRNK